MDGVPLKRYIVVSELVCSHSLGQHLLLRLLTFDSKHVTRNQQRTHPTSPFFDYTVQQTPSYKHLLLNYQLKRSA
jgi:hypothetical protein